MSSKARFGLLAGAFAVGVVALAIGTRHSRPEVRPGTTVLGVSEEGVRSVTYRAATMTLTARRGGAGPFAVQVEYSDGRAAQRCQASPDLAGLLPDLSEIEATRQLTPQQLATEFPVEVGVVDLEDNVDEPISPFMVHMSRDGRAVALTYSGLAIEADVSPAVFDKLGSGCAALAGQESRK